MALLIDTAQVQASDRVEFWSDSSCRSYHPVQIRTGDDGEFWARMWADPLGPLSVYRIAASANTMIRTARSIAAGDPECLQLEVILRGRVNAAQEGRTGVAHPGDLISYETSHPVLLQAEEPFESVVVRVPLHLLGPQAAQIAARTAVPISARHGLPRAGAAFLCRLAAKLDKGALSQEDVPRTVACILDLTRSLFVDPSHGTTPVRLRTRAEILLTAEGFIEANLADPHLGPDAIARASFISTRYLHKLFESEGTSVCRWIRTSRLERCRSDLADPAFAHQTILSIASRWGLPGAQHFSRVFRDAYGCSPNEFRRDAKRASSAASAGSA
jgi:AraC-like DNA-binding protein